ncbi:Lactoylglutathione lyase / glyoxalase I family protein [Hibiscus syriacus]|uniref:Lactoylglutathione lyase / glyoxalase I family protein n=1 Tax=Hibiscus syriacus TaxID=106335 RepID=A0A6A2YTV9_HIBSY|nr:Lactoylglutathione lyase / glyoxalase I family protein [Hibiscus syriacus]
MASKENKQKKLISGFLSSFYRSSTRSQKPKSEPAVGANNKPVSPSLLLKKLENGQTVDKDGQMGVEKEGIEGGGGGGGGKVVVEGRKSVSHIETNLSSVISFLQVKVLVSDMPGFMQVHAFRSARRTYDSLEKFSSRHMAYNIKKVCFKKAQLFLKLCIFKISFALYM